MHVGPGAARSRPCLQDGAGPASPAFPWESPGIYLDADTFSLRSYVLTVRGPWMRPPLPRARSSARVTPPNNPVFFTDEEPEVCSSSSTLSKAMELILRTLVPKTQCLWLKGLPQAS